MLSIIRQNLSRNFVWKRYIPSQSLTSIRSFSAESKDRSESTESKRVDGANDESLRTTPEPDKDQATRISVLIAENEEKESKIRELNDKTLRVLAEMENVRTIARRDVDNARKYGIFSFAKGLLHVADNLSLALRSVPEEKVSDKSTDPHLVGLYGGVKATEQELLKVFSQHGMVRYGEVGEQFDPLRHQALFEVPSATETPGIVVEITKQGYSIGDRILRPAEVGVSKTS